MALVNLFILAILVCLSVTVFSYSALPSRLNSKLALRQTRLYNTIHESAAAGDLATVMEVVNKDPTALSIYDIDGSQLLHHAAKNGHLEMVKFLCEKGPGMINFKNIRFRTPLHFSCSYAGYEGFEACRDISFYLVSLGGDLKVKNKDNLTPLDLAKKGPLGKEFANELLKASEGIPIRPVEIGARRVFWG